MLEVAPCLPRYVPPLSSCLSVFAMPPKVFWISLSFGSAPQVLEFVQISFANFLCLPRSVGSTERTKSNPLGRLDSKAVRLGNLLCARAIILMLLCSAKGVMWCLEQPSSSVMEFHPLFQKLLALTTVRRLLFRMSQFGSPTPKRTVLYSSGFSLFGLILFVLYLFRFCSEFVLTCGCGQMNMGVPLISGHRCISQLLDFTVPERLREREMVVHYTNGAGQRRFHGGQHLKDSQSYPAGLLVAFYETTTITQVKNIVYAVYTLSVEVRPCIGQSSLPEQQEEPQIGHRVFETGEEKWKQFGRQVQGEFHLVQTWAAAACDWVPVKTIGAFSNAKFKLSLRRSFRLPYPSHRTVFWARCIYRHRIYNLMIKSPAHQQHGRCRKARFGSAWLSYVGDLNSWANLQKHWDTQVSKFQTMVLQSKYPGLQQLLNGCEHHSPIVQIAYRWFVLICLRPWVWVNRHG